MTATPAATRATGARSAPVAPPAVQWPADSVERRPVASLVPYAHNARTHSDEQVAQIAASIREWGWTMPILVDEAGMIIAGHGRLLAAQRLGILEVPVVIAAGWTEAQKRAYVIADNKLTLNAGWDLGVLAAELGELRGLDFDLGLIGFGEVELAAILAPRDGANAAEGGAEDQADETPAPPRNPVSRPGDLWQLGAHRLLCGNSTDGAAVSRLMAGERASLLFTSPPYGNQRNYTTGGIADWDALMRGVFGHLGEAMADHCQILVNLGLVHRDNEWQPYWQGWLDWMRTAGWRRFGLYVWDQGPGLPGDWNGRLAPAFELLFHFNKQARQPNKIVPCKWAGHINDSHGGMRGKDGTVGEWTHAGQGVQETRIPDSVLRITRHKARGIETEHPAVFPVGLPEFVMNAYSNKGDVVFEPFAGSGTTLVAGERAGRRVRAIDLAPEYVDVALLRWRQLFPSSAIVLDGDGRAFEDIAAERGIVIDHAA